MKFWIIYNDMSQSHVYYEIVNIIAEGIKYHNHIYDLIPITKVIHFNCDISLISTIIPDYVWFWDKNWSLAYKLEQLGLKCINSPKNSLICENKFFTFKKLDEFNELIPNTHFYYDYKAIEHANFHSKFPIVLKSSYSELGNNVFIIKNYSDIDRLIVSKKLCNFMLQEYLDYLPSVEVKIITTQYRVISCYKREKIAGNYAITPYTPSDNDVKIALRCCNTIGLKFVGVDLMYKGEFFPVVCDLNTQSNFYMSYKILGFNPVIKIIEELEQNF